jgi:hypothetical protein
MDERDKEIFKRREEAYKKNKAPRIGHYVRFQDGVERRISHVWTDENDQPESIQTSDGGSFYFGEGYMNFSGCLYIGVPANSLRKTEEKKCGSAWFFHHDFWTANNAVDVQVECAVWECSVPAPR